MKLSWLISDAAAAVLVDCKGENQCLQNKGLSLAVDGGIVDLCVWQRRRLFLHK